MTPLSPDDLARAAGLLRAIAAEDDMALPVLNHGGLATFTAVVAISAGIASEVAAAGDAASVRAIAERLCQGTP